MNIDEDSNNFQDSFKYRKTPWLEKIKSFAYFLAILGIVGGGHAALSEDNNTKNNSAASQAQIGQNFAALENNNNSTPPSEANIFMGIVNDLLSGAQNTKQPGSAFYFPMKSSDGFENSFYDISLSYVKDKNGELITKIDDILVSKDTGTAEYVLFAKGDDIPENGYRYVNYNDVLIEEDDGDIHLSITKFSAEHGERIEYTEDILNGYLSLKYLKQADVITEDESYVGKVRAVIYDNNKLQNIYIAVVPKASQATAPRLVEIPFNDADIRFEKGGYNIYVSAQTTRETENLE